MSHGRGNSFYWQIKHFFGIAICLVSMNWWPGQVVARTFRVTPDQSLQSVMNSSANNDTLLLLPGSHRAAPIAFVDSLCGNCQEQQTAVEASYGFRILGKSLTLIGADRNATQLVTRAGYGLWIVNAPDVTIQNLTITGGVRDSDGNATDAGIVVRNSRVTVHKVTVTDNQRTDTTIVVGIGGIFGREGAELIINDCEIVKNSWDGIALYRGAHADVSDCTIHEGRGAGIGVTWDATCNAVRNNVSGYWKGIGAFGTAWVVAQNNIIHHNLGWGMVATGDSYMDMSNNVVYANGNCGVAPWSVTARGRIVNNIITNNGWRKQWVCPCVGVWNYGDWAKWEFANNIVWNNVEGDYRDIWDQTDLNGNLNVDPQFTDTLSFHLTADSPARDAGLDKLSDPDGSRADIGAYGGPRARRR